MHVGFIGLGNVGGKLSGASYEMVSNSQFTILIKV